MNTLSLDNCGVVEMDSVVMRETDGGYGYYPGMQKDAACANKLMGDLWQVAKVNFYYGYNSAKTGYNRVP